MKTKLVTRGKIELNSNEVLEIISDHFRQFKRFVVVKISPSTKMTVFVQQVNKRLSNPYVDEPTPEPRWSGLYSAVREIIQGKKMRKKSSITFDELYKSLLQMEDSNGQRKFVKNGSPITRARVKQYLSPSQLKKQKNMTGIRRKVGDDSLYF